jgi:coenzyme F420-reducing hydrogenase delta subunit
MLGAIEAGARAVVVVACPKGADRYPKATERLRRRVEQAQGLLAEVGLGRDRIVWLEAADQPPDALRDALAAATTGVLADSN